MRVGSLTLITDTLSKRGLVSTDRIGLVLLLCPGVELELLADRCELSLCGSGNRTMADRQQRKCAEETRETQKRKEAEKENINREAWPPLDKP